MNSLWIIVTGILVAASCGVVGCFLVLRRLAMLGDAISHALLPGIVVAFLLTNSRASLPMFLGAIAVGLLTTFLIQTLSTRGVQGDAAIGVTFTTLFAIGVVLLSNQRAEQVDLDVDCVLYGEILYSGLYSLTIGGVDLGPRAVWTNGALLLLNLVVIRLFYKEFKICAFDPEMAAAVGISVTAMHYLLMGLVSVTVVGAFESVGAILVVAMLIVPGATAYLLTDRLERMLLYAMGIGAASAVAGYLVSRSLDCSPTGAMATAGGVFFALAFLFSPSHGVVSRWVAQRRLRRRVAAEDVLLWGVRRQEAGAAGAFTLEGLQQGLEWLPADASATARRLARAGLLQPQTPGYALTASGETRGMELLRAHRVYESYLGELGYPVDHVHGAADRVEHHLSAELTAAVNAAARNPERDPQGKPIPPGNERG